MFHSLLSFCFSHTVGGSDYTSQAVDLTFNAANPRQTVTIMTFMDDVVEGVETFTVFLNSSDTALDVRLQSATVSIVDQRSKHKHALLTHVYENWVTTLSTPSPLPSFPS